MEKKPGNMEKKPGKSLLKKDAVQLDISGFDRSTIIWRVRGAYRKGCNEIAIRSSNVETAHLRKTDKLPVQEVVKDQGRRLIGATIDIIDPHSMLLHVEPQGGNPDEVIGRVLERIVSMHAEFLLLLKGHLYAAGLIEEKHDSTTKLITYCQLLLTSGPHGPDETAKYHLVADIDKVADIIKYMARDYSGAAAPMSKTGIELIASVHECIQLVERSYRKYSAADVTAFSLKRDDVKRQIRTTISTLERREAFLLGQATCLLEMLIDMMEYIMQLQLPSKPEERR